MEINSEQKREIEELLSEEESSLFGKLGNQALASLIEGEDAFGIRELLSQPQGMPIRGKKELGALDASRFGRLAFKKKMNQLYDAVCVKWDYCNKAEDKSLNKKVNLVIAVADSLSSRALGFPAILISVILVKMGLEKFCECDS